MWPLIQVQTCYLGTTFVRTAHGATLGFFDLCWASEGDCTTESWKEWTHVVTCANYIYIYRERENSSVLNLSEVVLFPAIWASNR